jgi:hypothetical protein
MSDLHRRVFTCRHVLEDAAPILQAQRDDDGDLQLLCGASEHSEEDARAMLGAMIMDHPSLVDVMELDRGQIALRADATEPWKVSG